MYTQRGADRPRAVCYAWGRVGGSGLGLALPLSPDSHSRVSRAVGPPGCPPHSCRHRSRLSFTVLHVHRNRHACFVTFHSGLAVYSYLCWVELSTCSFCCGIRVTPMTDFRLRYSCVCLLGTGEDGGRVKLCTYRYTVVSKRGA